MWVGSSPLSPQQVFRQCVPEDSPTARTLRCLGQSMLFAPLSHVKHLVHRVRATTALFHTPNFGLEMGTQNGGKQALLHIL